MSIDKVFREQIVAALCAELEPLGELLAGWEGGSAALGTLDAYSDIDLNFLVGDTAAFDSLYQAAERSLATISPIVACHSVPPGRYYKLKDGGDFLLVDLCFFTLAPLSTISRSSGTVRFARYSIRRTG